MTWSRTNGRGGGYTRRSRNCTWLHWGCLEWSLPVQVIPNDTASMAASEWRTSTLHTYYSQLVRLGGRSADNKIALSSASLAKVSQFLMVLFNQGKQENTINNCCSVITAVHRASLMGPHEGSSHVIKQTLKGMSNSRPLFRPSCHCGTYMKFRGHLQMSQMNCCTLTFPPWTSALQYPVLGSSSYG